MSVGNRPSNDGLFPTAIYDHGTGRVGVHFVFNVLENIGTALLMI